MEYQATEMDMSKPELISQLKEYLSDARNTPISELLEKGDYGHHPDLKYPQTRGEYLADSISTLLASQSWIDGGSEPELDEMLEITGRLDVDVNQPQAWRKLFELSEKMKVFRK